MKKCYKYNMNNVGAGLVPAQLQRNTQKGITLVALVITIIVLLILVVVSINLLINNGILEKAEKAVEEYKISSAQEKIKLAVQELAIEMQLTSKSQEEKIEFLKSKLEDAEVIDNENNGFIIEYKGYKFEVINNENNNYSVERTNREDYLPSAYQKVDYIESDGDAYINTEFIPIESTNVKYKYMPIKDIGLYPNFLSADENVFPVFRTGIGNSFTYLYCGYNGKITNAKGSYNTIYEISAFIDNKMIINGISYSVTRGTKNPTKSLYLFTWASNPGYYNYKQQARLYNYLKIYNGEELVRNFIPCYRKSDGEVGIYDTVTKQFFVNQGTGEFTYGYDNE